MINDSSLVIGSRPLVSVIIPCFRQARYLPEALECVFAQTYPAVEAIVINDGSDDDTPEVAARYGAKIRYHYQENQGVSAARNAGIRLARGEYLLFLDADDLLHPEAVARLMEAMHGQKNRLCVMDFCFFEGNPPRPAPSGPCQPEPFPLLPELISRCIVGPPHTCLCSRDMADAVNGFESSDPEILGTEDFDFWQRLAFRSAEGVRIPFVGAFYRRHPGTVSTNLSKMLRARTKVLLRSHRRILSDPANLDHWGPMLLRAEYRVRRHWLALGLQPSAVPILTQSIAELESRGIRINRSPMHRLIHTTLGGVFAERLILKYFRLFKPRTFTQYVSHYH